MGIGNIINPDKNKTGDNFKANNQNGLSMSFNPEMPKYSLDDLILTREVKDKILDVAEYVENSKIVFENWGFNGTHKYSKRVGINFYGEPGTGKTMAAHALANYLGRKILIVNYAELESKYVGETPKNIKKVFETAKETNSVLFFDEADAILSKRVTNMNNATDVSVNQTRSVLLMLLNDYQDFVVFATNFIENFDPAFMRRISMHVKFELPDEECRVKLWRKYVPNQLPHNIDFYEIAGKYSNISGSDISTSILNAAFKAARSKSAYLDKSLVFDAIQDIIKSKEANMKRTVKTETRAVSEEYVKKQLEK